MPTTLINLTGAPVTLSTWVFGEEDPEEFIIIPQAVEGSPSPLIRARKPSSGLNPCVRVRSANGQNAGYLYPSFIVGGPLLGAADAPLPPREEGNIYIVPEAIRLAHPERIDLASVGPEGGLVMSPWESA